MSAPTPRASLLALVRHALTTRTSLSLVGLPGSGRTSFLGQVRDAAEDDGWDVVSVPSFGRSDGHPLESLVLAGLVPGTAGPLGSLASAVESVRRAVADGPTLLLLDDADALDDVSVSVLAAVAAGRDVGVVVTRRPPVLAGLPVDRLLARGDTTVLPLPVLPFEEIHALTCGLLGGDVFSDVVGRVYALSGGLPGIARSIVLEARRAGHLVGEGARWVARRDLWTPGLAATVSRLVAGLSTEATEALWILATLGVAEVGTVRRLLPWSVVVELDDHGLVRFVQEEDRALVLVFPPLLGEHLRHTGHGGRGQRAVETIASTLGTGADDDLRVPRRPVLGSPMRWSSSPESAAILDRVLREQSATRLLACRDAWQREASVRNTLVYLEALLTDGAPRELVEHVLDTSRPPAEGEPSQHQALVRVWEASYRALVLHDPAGALTLLSDVLHDDPHEAELVDAVVQHVRLVVGDGTSDGAVSLPGRPATTGTGAEHAADDAGEGHGPPERGTSQVEDVVRLVRGEVLLARGRVIDAVHELCEVRRPGTVPLRDAESIIPLAQMCAGEIEAATDRSLRLLDQARGTLERGEIEPHGYVVALGLFLQGRLTSLREHLTGIFAISAPAPLRPSTRAGLLSMGASLALLEGNLKSARSMVSQIESLHITGASAPLTGPHAAAAALALATGDAAQQTVQAAWDEVVALADRGAVLAAVFDAASLVGLAPDSDRARRLADLAEAAQGTLLPVLGRYLRASADRSADLLLTAAADLSTSSLVLHATLAHAAAVRVLRADGQAARATEETARLRRTLNTTGEELSLLVPVLTPAADLTTRELEVAQLIAQGLTNKDVAERLVVSDRTVDNHVYRIFRKLGVTSRDEVAGLL